MEDNRSRVIVRTSIIGIVANVFLAAFKAFVGTVTSSVAITMDAVNNLSDAMSSVITIIGTKLAGKRPDKKHPYGYGRIEYLSTMTISVIILYAGISALIESVKSIISAKKPEYTTVSLLIIAVAVLVKIFLGLFVKSRGKKVNSDSLSASGQDALMDSIISASTLAAAGIYIATKVSLEAWLGAVIAIVIIKSGLEMLRDTISDIIGRRADAELSKNIKSALCEFPEVSGAYDLVIHNYGPEIQVASVHVEVPDTMTAEEIDRLTRRINTQIFQKFHIVMTAVGIYSVNSKDDQAAKIREDVRRIVMSHDEVVQMHGFYLDDEIKTMSFDIVVSFAAKDRIEFFKNVIGEVQNRYPDYKINANMDADTSD